MCSPTFSSFVKTISIATALSFAFVSFASLSFIASVEDAETALLDTEKDLANATIEVPDKIAIDQADLVYFDTDYGRVIMQITDIQSPKAAQQFKSLVNEGYYDGLDFYRVIEGFVAQGGEYGNDNQKPKKSDFRSTLKAEFTAQTTEQTDFHSVQKPEFLAPETGFINGFPAGRNEKTGEHWLLHCPGTLALGRENAPDTASTEFYVTLGHAPRHLDRNMSVIGRVVEGMEVLQRMPRGEPAKSGIIEKPNKRGTILKAKLGTQLGKSQQTQFLIDNTRSNNFAKRLESARHNTGPFLVFPGSGNVDVCYYRPRITRVIN